MLARIGGEEFVALIPDDASKDGAFAAAERLRLAVAMHPWSTLSAGLSVTISVGVARPSEVCSNAQLLVVADRRLYAAKAAGRNRCVSRD